MHLRFGNSSRVLKEVDIDGIDGSKSLEFGGAILRALFFESSNALVLSISFLFFRAYSVLEQRCRMKS